ncbi:hypothetical protein [Spirosoma sp. KNUC1025]|uniref:hypothetical protein n=1 Tax=Spirosoma sp. KNUC1025 TaxID=2894082 RepID=UPI003867378B|nr:hypothetical protein LN737_19075 [Spirosoma sp. KNUC1025]
MLNNLQWLLGVNTTKQSQADNDRNLLKFSAFLVAKKPHLTLEEIELAYELACDGELDVDVFPVLNPLHFGRVMKAYQSYRASRTDLMQPIRNGLAQPEPTQVDSEAIMIESLRLALNAVKENGGVADYGNALYDWLDGKGLIPFDNARKWEFMNEAVEKVKNDAVDRLNNRTLHKSQKLFIRDTLKDFLNDAFTKSTQDRIKVMAKYLALNALLADLVDMNYTAEEYLSEALTPQIDNQ